MYHDQEQADQKSRIEIFVYNGQCKRVSGCHELKSFSLLNLLSLQTPSTMLYDQEIQFSFNNFLNISCCDICICSSYRKACVSYFSIYQMIALK